MLCIYVRYSCKFLRRLSNQFVAAVSTPRGGYLQYPQFESLWFIPHLSQHENVV